MGKFFTARRLAAALVLWMPLLAPLQVFGAGLGKLTVLSALGQPLSAEIEIVSLQPGEDESLVARVASTEAFRQAGVEFNAALLSVRFSIERRSGRPFVKLSSSQPLNEPFVEVLVELSWNSGRLVREYTFLLDPPEYRGLQPMIQTPAVAPAKPAAAPAARAVPAPRTVEERPLAAPARPAVPAAAPAVKSTYEVKKGDTLAKIARQNAAPNVTLQQMLVALYRANPDAFIDSNINRLRAGRILNVPGPESAQSIDQEDARRLVAAQAQDFREYQSKLAGAVAAAPADPVAPRKPATGRITAPQEAPRSAEAKDQLKLSKADPAAKGAQSRAAREDNLAAREKAVKDTESRIAELEKNVQDLQKLLELKSQSLAELEKKGTAKPPAPPVPAAPAPATPAPAASKPAPVAEAPKPAPVAEAPKPVPAAEAPKPAAEAPKPAAEAPKVAEAPKPPAADPPKPKPAAPPPPPPPPPPSLLDEFLEDWRALVALGVILLALAGYFVVQVRRKKASQSRFQDSVLGASPAALGSASVFGGAAAAGSADDAAPRTEPVAVSDGGAAISAADSDEVDPIAEADVYMAYGRDAQAEEILKDALGKDPDRVEIHLKLVEIFAGRRDTGSLEQAAMKIKDLTGGQGPDWDKVVAVGRTADPSNSLYGGEGGEPSFDSTVILPAGTDAGAAPTLDFDLDAASPAAPQPDISLDDVPPEAQAASIDFDLGGADEPAATADVTPAAPEPDATAVEAAPAEEVVIETKDADDVTAGLDFDLGMGDAEKPAEPPPVEPLPEIPAAPQESAAASLDFDLELDVGALKEDEPDATLDAAVSLPEKAEQPLPEMDMSSISFDLDAPAEAAPAQTAPAVSGPAGEAVSDESDPRWQEVATKLDLAKAYEEMGDKDGARDLLNEVIKEGDDAQQKKARDMLSNLG